MYKLAVQKKTLIFQAATIRSSLRKALALAAVVAFTFISERVAFSASASPVPNPAPSTKSGKASDLGPAMGLSWPLDAPLSCQALKTAVQESTKDAALKLQAYCNQASQEMEQKGYPRCSPNLCPVQSSTNSSAQDSGNIKARISYYPDNNSIFISLTYNFPIAEPTGSSLICFDPMVMALEVVQNEIDTWDFKKFVAFCVNGVNP
ncbi:MAG: hypothetical protein WCI18_15960 [Pseudomonadota bacterium]